MASLFFAGFYSCPAFSGVGSQVHIQIRDGQFCGQVDRRDFYDAFPEEAAADHLQCDHDNPTGNNLGALEGISDFVSGDPLQAFQDRVFAEAAQTQVTNDNCLAAMIDRLQNDQRSLQGWKMDMVHSWLRAKKTSLLRERCDVLRNYGFGDEIRGQAGNLEAWEAAWQEHERRQVAYAQGADRIYGAAGASRFLSDLDGTAAALTNENLRERIYQPGFPMPPALMSELVESEEVRDRYRDMCINEENYAALQGAEAYYMQTVPIVNGQEFHQAVEAARGSILSQATGQALTDAEILSMDLRDINTTFGQLNLSSPDSLNGLDDLLEQTENQRREMAEGLAGALNTQNPSPNSDQAAYRQWHPGSELSRAQRSYLYQQGAVLEVLEERGQVTPNSQGGFENPTQPATCLMSQHETTLIGEVGEFLVTGLVGGPLVGGARVAVAAARGARALNGARALSFGNSMTAAGVSFGIREIDQNCFVNSSRDGVRTVTPNSQVEDIRTGNILESDLIQSGSSFGSVPDLSSGRGDIPPVAIDSIIRAPQCAERYGYLRQHYDRMSCMNTVLMNGAGAALFLPRAFSLFRQ